MAKMTSGMRMMAMARASKGERREFEHGRMQDGGGMSMMDEPEMRRRDSRGRYMEGNTSYHMPPYLVHHATSNRRMTDEPDGQNPYGGQPEVYRRQEEREERERGPEMRRMESGKTSGGEISYNRPDGASGNVRYFMHKTDPMNQKDGEEHYEQPRQIGFHQREEDGLDKETVMSWVDAMEDSEGVRGGKYTWHQAQQYAMNMGITGQQRILEFYWAMNAMYSDYQKVGKKFGVDKPEFYAHLAKCFIEDPDAKDNKVEEYIKHVVKND